MPSSMSLINRQNLQFASIADVADLQCSKRTGVKLGIGCLLKRVGLS